MSKKRNLNRQSGQRPPLTAVAPPEPACVNNALAADALAGQAKEIATGVHAIASNLRPQDDERSTLLRLWGYAKIFTAVVGTLIGALFATETFLQHQQENYRTQADLLFNSSREQLASPQPAIQANAVRAIPELAKFQNIIQSQPSHYFLGAHLLNRFVYRRTELPLRRQCWLLFREFAQQPRAQRPADGLSVDVVSSALLQEGAKWEMHIRSEPRGVPIEMSGGLLFKARLGYAQGNDQNYTGLNLTGSDLRFANLSNADITDANLLLSNVEGASFNGAVLRGTSLAEVKGDAADFSFAKCATAIFRKAHLDRAVFRQADLTEADFSGATLEGAAFSQAVLLRTRFAGASLKNAVFSQVDLSFADFTGADLDGADLRSAVGISSAILQTAINARLAKLPNSNP